MKKTLLLAVIWVCSCLPAIAGELPVEVMITVNSWSCRANVCLIQVSVIPRLQVDSRRLLGQPDVNGGSRKWTLRADEGLEHGNYLGTVNVDKIQLQVMNVKGSLRNWKGRVVAHEWMTYDSLR